MGDVVKREREDVLVRNTLIISIGSAGSSIIRMLNVLLFTHYVAVEKVGDYDMAATYVGLLAPLAMLALNESAYRWLLEEAEEKASILTTTLFMSVISVCIINIGIGLVLFVVEYKYIVELLASITTTAFYTYSQFVTRGLRNNRLYALQGIVYAVSLLVSNVVLVIVFPMQARGLLWSVVVANFVATVFAFRSQRLLGDYVRRDAFRSSLVKPFVTYSMPIVPNNVAWWLVSACNRVIINIGIGPFANGIYAIANRFPSVLNMTTTFFYQAWQEQAITEYSSEERDAYYSRVFNAYVRVILGGVLALLPASKLVVDLLVSSDYAESSLYLGPLFMSSAFSAFAAFYGTGYLSTKKTGGALMTTIVGAAVNVACSWLLIKSLGLQAAAFGSMLGNLAIWLTRIAQTRRYFAISVEVVPLLAVLCLCALMSVVVPRVTGVWLACLELVSIWTFFVLNKALFGGVVTRIVSKLSR